MKILVILFTVIVLISCRSSYQFTPKGFIVEGDEYFVNVDRNMSVYVGNHFLNYDKKTKIGLQTGHLSKSDKQLIQKLGYSTSGYTVLFSGQSTGDSTFRLISLINNKTSERFKNTKNLISKDGFSIKRTEEGKYYYQITTFKRRKIYHAIIPFKQELGKEEYVSLIYIIPDRYNDHFDQIEDLAISNAAMYSQHYIFTPSRTEILCPDDSSRGHFDYKIPTDFIQRENYTLMKGFLQNGDGATKLIIYRLLQPGQSYGSFVVCKGIYQLELTDLQHRVIWRKEVVVNDDHLDHDKH
ncbi:hypothetical protein ABE426_12940 [Sphingobacterium faecium]|jgi:hypothetical protein|uniref:hypothetical protein n=1 Tax=Sphingobacterium TaxID=28453 RepID=UPI0025EDB5F4|nr:hypothetical protein [Sphingobacterium sp. UBA6320]